MKHLNLLITIFFLILSGCNRPPSHTFKAQHKGNQDSKPSGSNTLHIPTSGEISQVFDLPNDFNLTVREEDTVGKTYYGNILWGRNYSNSNRSLFGIEIALAEGGSFLSSEAGMILNQIENDTRKQTGDRSSMVTETKENKPVLAPDQQQEFLDTIKTNAADKRIIYSLPVMGSPSGSSDLTILTSKDGKYDLMIVVSEDFERDVPPDKQMKNPVRLKMAGKDVIERLEGIIYK
jgi:hypothetical protein